MTPRRPSPLPAHLRQAAFRVREHGFHGLERGRLAGADLQRPYSGMRSLGLDLHSVLDRCLAYEPLLRPGEAFSHSTALELLGLPAPAGTDFTRIHVTAPPGMTRVRRPEVVGHESAERLPLVLVHGVRVVSAPVVWCQLGAQLTRENVVALGDAIVSSRRIRGGRAPALATIDDLADARLRWGGRRGAARLEWAITRIRTGVDSIPETLTRLFMVSCGHPEPRIGYEIEVAGGRLLHPDLVDAERRIAYEYEGDAHRSDIGRWRSDIRRHEELADAGWRVVRVTWDDLTVGRSAFAARLAGLRSSRQPLE